MTVTSRNLNNKISEYILKKTDINCEEELDKTTIIKNITDNYKIIFKSDYLDWISNDLLIFIGFKTDLEENNDEQGLELWNYLNNMMVTNNKSDENKIRNLMKKLPYYYLLSFLGISTIKLRNLIMENIELVRNERLESNANN